MVERKSETWSSWAGSDAPECGNDPKAGDGSANGVLGMRELATYAAVYGSLDASHRSTYHHGHARQ